MIASIAIGAVIKSISLKSLEEMQIPLPDMTRQREIGARFKVRFDWLKAAKTECERLLREMRSVCQGAV